MRDPYFQSQFAERIGGAGYGKGTETLDYADTGLPARYGAARGVRPGGYHYGHRRAVRDVEKVLRHDAASGGESDGTDMAIDAVSGEVLDTFG